MNPPSRKKTSMDSGGQDEIQAIRNRMIKDQETNRGQVHIRSWLENIGETDQAIIDEVMERCKSDSAARAYFLKRTQKSNT